MLKLYYQLYKYNKDGQLIKRTHQKKAKSFVKYFLFHLASIWAGGSPTTNDIFNTSRGLNTNFMAFFNPTGAGLDSNKVAGRTALGNSSSDYVASTQSGIQIGTGSTAITSTDYALATQIAHGTSAGQMLYYGTWIQNLTIGASTGSYDIERIFYNGSGSSITVNEMGVYCVDYGANYQFCAIRDLVSPGVTVTNGEYLKVKYTIQISV